MKIKRHYFSLTATIFLMILTSSCASIIKTTGAISLENKINKVGIVCITPDIIGKFSNNLCQNLKTQITSKGVTVMTKVYDEMTPTLTEGIKDSTLFSDADVILKITHLRISLYNGVPNATLMNVAMYNVSNKEKPIWVARIQTKGFNISGVGNPEKVSQEILNQLIADGFKF